jgi:hypothetical protein
MYNKLQSYNTLAPEAINQSWNQQKQELTTVLYKYHHMYEYRQMNV